MEKRKITISVATAEINNIGVYPKDEILKFLRDIVRQDNTHIFQDFFVTYTRNKIVLIFSHTNSPNSSYIKNFYSECFEKLEIKMKHESLFVLEKIISHLVEIQIGINFEDKERSSESFAVIVGSKCPIKIFNYALYHVFCDPVNNKELVLNSKFRKGFTVNAVNTEWENKEVILKIPEQNWDLFGMIENIEKAFIKEIYSLYRPEEKIMECGLAENSFTAIIRAEGLFPSVHQIVKPYSFLRVAPLPFGTPFTDPYDLPTVSCLVFSMNEKGGFTGEGWNYGGYVDVFDNPAWEAVRLRIQKLAYENRFQGFPV